MKKTILISTSPFGNPISDYFNCLANKFIKNNYKVIFIFDGLSKANIDIEENKSIYYWPSQRPTKFSDFLFYFKLIKKEKPILCISNFGSTNIVSLGSYILNIKNRMNYIHTTSKQLRVDSTKNILKTLVLKKRKQIIYSLNTLLLTNSEGTRKDSITYYKLKREKIKIFPLLIKHSNIKYKENKEREYSISIVGRLHPSKGHRELLYLFKECLVKYPNLKLNIIGDGYLKNELIKLSKELKIIENVVFTGNIPNFEIGVFLSKSLINISASIDEAYGLVNIESLREGTPLICTKTAGSLDILSTKINGLYMNHDDKKSLLNALTLILNNWDFYSKNSIKTFEENYSLQNIEKHYKQIIKECSF